MNGSDAMEHYRRILDVLRSVPEHEGVRPIEPVGHEALSFFPGQRGFVGPSFPIGGVMFVANNYDNLKGWENYRKNLAAVDDTISFVRLTENIIPAAGLDIADCWLTNYALGVMDVKNSQYTFPVATRKALKLDEKFNEFVAIMQPRLIVALGGYVAQRIKAMKELGVRGDTKMIAIDHPGRRHKGREYFEALGQRLREAD